MKLSRDVTLYHVTPTSQVASILKEGLKPRLRRDSPVRSPAIYLGASPRSAAGWAMDFDEESQDMAWGGPMSILAVRLRKGRRVHFDPEGFSESFYVSKRIPPGDVRVVRRLWVGKLPEEEGESGDRRYQRLLESLPGHEEESSSL